MVPVTDGIEVFHPAASFLAGRGANFSSQFGEDGLVEACLERFGVSNQWCFEVGAADGLFFSNTLRLRDKGWHAVLIEGDAELYDKLRTLQSERVHTVAKRITSRSLDQILSQCGAPTDLDFGVIDIDGQDYWAWDGLRQFRPKLMLVEFAYTSEKQGEFVPELDGAGQAFYQSILRLGSEKQYTALAKTHCNILFVDSGIM